MVPSFRSNQAFRELKSTPVSLWRKWSFTFDRPSSSSRRDLLRAARSTARMKRPWTSYCCDSSVRLPSLSSP